VRACALAGFEPALIQPRCDDGQRLKNFVIGGAGSAIKEALPPAPPVDPHSTAPELLTYRSDYAEETPKRLL